MMQRSGRVATSIFIGLALAAQGCSGPQGGVRRIASEEGVVAGSPDQAGAWLFWPTSLRVHPLTRVVTPTEAGQPTTIDARVEFRDVTGEPTNVVGTVVLELKTDDGEPASQRWRVDINSIESHTERFDAITATYRFELTPTWTKPPVVGSTVTLSVFLFGADGAMLQASQKLRW